MSPIPTDAHGDKPSMQVGHIDPLGAETVHTDVIVVGAGAAGLSAANAVVANGGSVVVLEAGAEPGGTTNKSAGGFMITANRFHREAGIIEDRDATLRLMAKTSFPERYDPAAERLGLDVLDHELLCTFFDRSNEVVTELEDDGVLTLTPTPAMTGEPRGLPSYFTQLEDETIVYGRTLGPLSADGIQGYGRELIRQLLSGAQRRGATVLCGHRVTELLHEADGEVTGVVAGGRQFLAAKGVVFATGGFAQNRAMVEEHMPGLVMGSCANPHARGDLIALTQDLDVELGHLGQAWWGEVPAEVAAEDPEVTALLFYPFGDSMIYVDREGRRVVNEKAVYDQRGPIHFARDADGGDPNRLLFMIYDRAVAKDPNDLFPARWPVPPSGESAPYVIEASTLEALEAEVRVRLRRLAPVAGDFALADGWVDTLRTTIATFNRYAERGVDPEFGRGREPIQVDGSGPGRIGSHPNRTMYPIAGQGPYYCIITAAGMLDTKGGPRTSARSEVLRADGTAVPRLYAAGNCAASPAAASYWAGGTTLGLGMTFGYIAGQQVSALETRARAGDRAALA